MKIAVTGGIGSGKSAFAEAVSSLGYKVFSCDEIYKEISLREEYLGAVKAAFGAEAVRGGALNREFLSSQVFSDGEKLKKLNSISHPLVMRELLKRMEGYEISFAEVPLLFEGSFQSLFDRVIIIYRDFEDRVSSVMARNSLTREEVLSRMASQIDYETLLCDYDVIYNDGDIISLKKKAEEYVLGL